MLLYVAGGCPMVFVVADKMGIVAAEIRTSFLGHRLPGDFHSVKTLRGISERIRNQDRPIVLSAQLVPAVRNIAELAEFVKGENPSTFFAVYYRNGGPLGDLVDLVVPTVPAGERPGDFILRLLRPHFEVQMQGQLALDFLME